MLNPLYYTVRRKRTRPQSLAESVYYLMMAGIGLNSRLTYNVMQSTSFLDPHPVENLSRLMRIGMRDFSRGDT